MSSAQPLYVRLKEHLMSRIRAGDWEAGRRVPSENELVQRFGVSRMTANRALRELSADGYLDRVPGVGTFVRARPQSSSLIEVRNIAEEIAARGGRHSSRVITREKLPSSPPLAREFELSRPTKLDHIVLVHEENGLPVQIEDRYVNPAAVPGFLKQDFERITPTAYLLSAIPVEELEHSVSAIQPSRWQRKLLRLEDGEPCLALRRRSWSGGRVVTFVTLVYPGCRSALYSRYRTNAQGTLSH
jgi:GntR family histidine utilization transcriptional repressor